MNIYNYNYLLIVLLTVCLKVCKQPEFSMHLSHSLQLAPRKFTNSIEYCNMKSNKTTPR